MTTVKAIEAAAARLAGKARVTPLLSSPFIDEIAGRRVLIKAECLQRTGSFKFRGGFAALSALPPEVAAAGVLTYSSGNHAQGIALAGQLLGIPVTIIMPEDAPVSKIAATRAYGAEIITYARATKGGRETLAAEISQARGLTVVSPYDEVEVIAGQGTAGMELAQQLQDAGMPEGDVLVCCGGGGLAAGMALMLEDRNPGLRVRTAEPEGFDDMARSLVSGEREENPALSGSICDAILTLTPGKLPFSILKGRAGPGVVVSDAECLKAMAAAFQHLKVVVEPGGAAALAAALYHGSEVSGDTVACVVTGGNVDADVFRRALQT